MIKVCDIANYLNSICPQNLAEDWDNVGLLIGNENSEVKKIMLCLDVDFEVAKEAIEKNVNLIISHHPVVFHPLKTLTEDNAKTIRELIKNDISVYSAHTNLDVLNGGLNDLLAKKVGLTQTEVLIPTGEFQGKICGYGRYGVLKEEIKFSQFAKTVMENLGLKTFKFSGDENKLIKKVAVNSGGGASMMDACFDKEIDLYITGDFKYSGIRDAYENSLCIIDAGHYETEIIAQEWFDEKLKEKFKEIDILKSIENKNPVKFYNI